MLAKQVSHVRLAQPHNRPDPGAVLRQIGSSRRPNPDAHSARRGRLPGRLDHRPSIFAPRTCDYQAVPFITPARAANSRLHSPYYRWQDPCELLRRARVRSSRTANTGRACHLDSRWYVRSAIGSSSELSGCRILRHPDSSERSYRQEPGDARRDASLGFKAQSTSLPVHTYRLAKAMT